MRQIRLGLTGGIGAGKSTVANILRELGADVASGDEFGRETLQFDTDVMNEIVNLLGADMRSQDGSPNRRAIAQAVFPSADLTKWLTAMTFPGIYSRWQWFVTNSDAAVVVLDASLIFEWGIENEFDHLLVVTTTPEIARVRTKSRLSDEDFTRRIEAQIPVEKKISHADTVIENNGSLDELKARVHEIWNRNILPLTT